MKRILSLDGGGIRGVFTIAILERIEALLREHYKDSKPGLVLADYFDFIGGTSTGAIIAALLSKGLSVR
ncbi:MAG: patatin-like phospholipase family protein, partial [Verrucomicrobiota bacterium]